MCATFEGRFADPHQRSVFGRVVSCACITTICWLATSSFGWSEETTARLRLAWGSGGEVKQRWTGSISIDGATLSDLQPLGVEVDASVGLRIEGERLVVAPLLDRGFDGCDLTVRADDEALVRAEFRKDQNSAPTIFEAPLRQIIREQLRQPLDDPGSFFLAHRAPGDKLKVVLNRDHFVFSPEETWTLQLKPDLDEELSLGPVQLDIKLLTIDKKKVLWQAGRQITLGDADEIQFDIECPTQEGAYRLAISARTPEGFATRFVPDRFAKVFASREVEFVVVDPSAKLPLLTEAWEQLLTLDPANPSWWQRLPSWTQTARLSNKAAKPAGNVRPVIRETAQGKIVELPATASEADPSWQSYLLPVHETGVPHVVEIQYPLDHEQHLEVSVIEPNAAGLVLKIGGGSGLYNYGELGKNTEELGTHRLIFWPKTRSPQLLIVNRHPEKPAQYGKITLLQHDLAAEAEETASETNGRGRIVAGYLSKPSFTENFGAAETLDTKSGLSVQSWSTFLDAANRMAQYLRYSGQNSVILSVAADGSSLYPSKVLNPSPRYDTGMLASNGQDPVHKDVLELLFRVFDREGIQIVPTVQLSAPLPKLEKLQLTNNNAQAGIGYLGPQGTTWLQENPDHMGLTSYYNLLNRDVQKEIRKLILELPQRYGKHASFAGVAIQLSGNGYGILPGLTWGLDDATVAAFSQDSGIKINGEGPLRFRTRAQQLLGTNRKQWKNWRTEQVTQFYREIANDLQSQRSDLQLTLVTEDIFAGTDLQRQVRQSLTSPVPVRLSQVLLEHGIHLARLNKTPGIAALSPYRLSASDDLQSRAIDLRINSATEQGELVSIDERMDPLFHHASTSNHLRSFDEQSPFGTDQTYLTLSSQSTPADAIRRRHLIKALARRDAYTVVEGGEFLSLSPQASLSDLLRTIQQLPGAEAASRTRISQPVVLRIYRSNKATTFAVINESPWPVKVRMPLKTSVLCDWQKLGGRSPSNEKSGRLKSESQEWNVELEPYDFKAWRFDSGSVRLGELQISLPDVVQADLKQRIEEIESRTGNLNIERGYPHLKSPGFELEEEGKRLAGWQPRVGTAGKVEIETREPRTGARAVRLRSKDSIGVAVQSELFQSPETGQLIVSAYMKAVKTTADTRLYIALEDGSGGRIYRKYATLGGKRQLEQEWARYEFPVDDLPIGSQNQLRVQFHLTGNAEVLLDDIELQDLRFDKARRGALVKRVYAAKTALEKGKVVDCLRLVDEYWSQFLVEHVPPFENTTVQLAKQKPRPQVELKKQEAKSRLPGWVQRIWR